MSTRNRQRPGHQRLWIQSFFTILLLVSFLPFAAVSGLTRAKTVVSGQRSAVSGQRSVVSGQRSTVSDRLQVSTPLSVTATTTAMSATAVVVSPTVTAQPSVVPAFTQPDEPPEPPTATMTPPPTATATQVTTTTLEEEDTPTEEQPAATPTVTPVPAEEQPAATPTEPAATPTEPAAPPAAVTATAEPQPQPAPPSAPQTTADMQQMRAFWAASYNEGYRNPGEADELIANMLRANANTLIVQMRRHGDAWYTRSIEPRAADPGMAPAEAYDALDYLIEKGHANGIEVHAWLVVSVSCRDQDPLRGHPQHVCTEHGPYVEGTESWTTVTYNGTPVGDLDFGHPSAIHHMEAVVQNMLQQYPGLDGLHFDFIRYTGKSYGYNQVSVERFNRAHGLPQDNWPDPDDPDWSQWRRDRMTELMRRLYIRSKAIDPQIEMSIAAITWGGPDEYNLASFQHSAAYARVFQDWQSWLQEGIIDFAVPMHYFEESRANNRSWLNGWLAWDHANKGIRAIVPGLGSWLNTPEQNIAQVSRALAPNAAGERLPGVAFYAYHNLFVGSDPQRRREFMDMLRTQVFPEPARAPDWPWIANPTKGMLQGMATIDGEIIPDAQILLLKDGVWVRDVTASVDGWYGAVELEPGNYTIIVRDPASERETQYENVIVSPGMVAFGS